MTSLPDSYFVPGSDVIHCRSTKVCFQGKVFCRLVMAISGNSSILYQATILRNDPIWPWLTNRRLFLESTPLYSGNEWRHCRVQNKNPAMNDVTAGYKICTRQFTSYQGCWFLLHSAHSFIQTGQCKAKVWLPGNVNCQKFKVFYFD